MIRGSIRCFLFALGLVLAASCATTGTQSGEGTAPGDPAAGEEASEEGTSVEGLYGSDGAPGVDGAEEATTDTAVPADGGGDTPEGTEGLEPMPEPETPGEAIEPTVEGATGEDGGDSAPAAPVLGAGGDVLVQEYRAACETADWALAEEKLGALLGLSPDYAKGHYELAVVKVRLGKSNEAIDSAIKAFETDPKAVDAGRLAIALLARAGRLPEAESLAEAAAAKDVKNVDLQNLKVDVLVERREYLRVIETARRLLKQDEINVPVMKNLARAYYLMGKEKTARYVFKRAQELVKNDPEILYYLALISDKTERDRKKVLAAYGKVIAARPDFPEALNNVGMVFFGTRNWELAAEKFAEAVKFAPGVAEFKLNLANAQRNLNNFEEADRIYQELIEQRPEHAATYYNRGLLFLENDFGGLDKETRLRKAADLLKQYKDVVGRELRAEDPADLYIKEAIEMADEVKKGKEEELTMQAELAEKLKNLAPQAEVKVKELEDVRKKLVAGMEAWKSVENADKVALFQEVITGFDEMVMTMVADLRSAVENKVVEDIEYLLPELDVALEDFQPTIDEAFEEPPPEVQVPPEAGEEVAPGEEGTGAGDLEPVVEGDATGELVPEETPFEEPTVEPVEAEPPVEEEPLVEPAEEGPPIEEEPLVEPLEEGPPIEEEAPVEPLEEGPPIEEEAPVEPLEEGPPIEEEPLVEPVE